MQQPSHFNGYPLKVVRDFLRGQPRQDLASAVEIGADFADTLIDHGLVVRCEDYLEITDRGWQLGIMKLIPRMSRAAINKLVVGIEQRALEVNTDERFAMQFVMLGLFGSVLNEKAQDFGDLDVVYRLDYKPYWEARRLDQQDHRWDRDLERFHLRHFPQDGRVWHMGTSPGVHRRPLQHVKARQGRISLHDEYDFEGLEQKRGKVPHRLLFGCRHHSLGGID